MAAGKTSGPLPGVIRDLCHAQEALQELVGLREEGTARIPPPSTPLPTTPRPEEPAMPVGYEMPCVSRSPPPQEMSPAADGTENMEEGTVQLWPLERVKEAQARFKVQHPLGTF